MYKSVRGTLSFLLFFFLQLPEVEVKDHPDDVRSFELHNPAVPNYPITLVAHKDPVKAYWLKEIRQYASDVVALAEHAADDLQVTEEVPSETKEEPKSDERPALPVKVEPRANPGPPKAQDSPKEEANPKAAAEAANPGPRTDSGLKDNNNAKVVEKRKESVGAADASEVKKSKIEEADMSRRYSSSRFSASSQFVEGEKIRRRNEIAICVSIRIESRSFCSSFTSRCRMRKLNDAS